jgi:hypothetical protein
MYAPLRARTVLCRLSPVSFSRLSRDICCKRSGFIICLSGVAGIRRMEPWGMPAEEPTAAL